MTPMRLVRIKRGTMGMKTAKVGRTGSQERVEYEKIKLHD